MRTESAWLIAACLLALVVRLVAAVLFPQVAGDGVVYSALGESLLHGEGLTLEGRPTMVRSPGYPVFVAVAYLVGGTSAQAVTVAQAFFGAATVVVVFLLAREFKPAVDPRFATAIAACCPFTAVYVRMVLTEVLSTFLTAVAMLLAVYTVRRQGVAHRLALGVILGVLILIRPDFAVFPIVIAVWVMLAQWPHVSAALRHAAFIMVVSAVVLVPWVVRNAYVFGAFQPLALPGGIEGVQPTGFLAWVRTWHDEPRERESAVWPYFLPELRAEQFRFPVKAFASPAERERVYQLLSLAELGRAIGQDTLVAHAEAGFHALAKERARRAPLRMWVLLPMRRAAGLWLTTRTEAFALPSMQDVLAGEGRRWMAIAKLLLGGASLLLVALGVAGAVIARRCRLLVSLAVAVILYRTAFHAYWAGMEVRYMLQAFPAVHLLAAAAATASWIYVRELAAANPKRACGRWRQSEVRD